MRGYKIIATDVDGNPTTVEHTFNPPIQTYIIMNEAQLKQFRDTVNVGRKNFTGKIVYLGADIELNKGKYTLDETGKIPTFSSDAEIWNPINLSYCLYGETDGVTFDGQGHKISGIYVKNVSDAGFFVSGGYGKLISKNLSIVESWIETKDFKAGGILQRGSLNATNCSFNGVSNNKIKGVVMENCYTVGKPNGYTAINGGNDCSIKNSFYLLGSYQYAAGTNATFTGVTPKNETYMKSQAFVDELNKGTDIWTRDDNINEGYPILNLENQF